MEEQTTTPPSGPAEPRRLECPNCGCRDLRVQYTRRHPSYTLRVRECRNCGRRVRTRERLA